MKARIRKRLDKKEIWPYPSRLCGDHMWYERAQECQKHGMYYSYGLVFLKSICPKSDFKVSNNGHITHGTVKPGRLSDGFSRGAMVLWVKMVSFRAQTIIYAFTFLKNQCPPWNGSTVEVTPKKLRLMIQ